MDYKEPELWYSDNNNGLMLEKVPCTITNYKPPAPVLNRKSNKVLLGYTHFQEKLKADTIIKFSMAFVIETEEDKKNFINFRNRYNDSFYFIDEFNITYKGCLQSNYDAETPVEGDIYYIAVEMLCPHEVSGYLQGEDDGL